MPANSFQSAAGRLAVTLLIAAAGGATFNLFGLPAAWLSGAMVFVAIATLAQVPTLMPVSLRDALFVMIGISMGAGVHPDIVDRVAEWPVSMAMLIAVMVAVTFAGYAVLHYGAKWSRETAYFGAIPGALSYVIALATERGRTFPASLPASPCVCSFWWRCCLSPLCPQQNRRAVAAARFMSPVSRTS